MTNEEMKQKTIDLVNAILEDDPSLGLYSAGEMPMYCFTEQNKSSYSYEIARKSENRPCIRITIEMF